MLCSKQLCHISWLVALISQYLIMLFNISEEFQYANLESTSTGPQYTHPKVQDDISQSSHSSKKRSISTSVNSSIISARNEMIKMNKDEHCKKMELLNIQIQAAKAEQKLSEVKICAVEAEHKEIMKNKIKAIETEHALKVKLYKAQIDLFQAQIEQVKK